MLGFLRPVSGVGGGQVTLGDELFSFLIPRIEEDGRVLSELFFVAVETENQKSPVGVGQTFPLFY